MNSTCAIGTEKYCGYYNDSSSRYGKSLKKGCSIPGCRFCTEFRNQETCYLCSSGFVLKKYGGLSVCETPSAELIGCVQTDSNSYCSLCDYGYAKRELYCGLEIRSTDKFIHNWTLLRGNFAFVLFLIYIT